MGFNGSSRVAPGGPAKSFGIFFSRRGIFLCFGGIFLKKKPARGGLARKIFFFGPGIFSPRPDPARKTSKILVPTKKTPWLSAFPLSFNAGVVPSVVP